jgi:hypothetical protein
MWRGRAEVGRAELGLMKWMHGITIGGVLTLLIKTFFG